MTTFKSRLCLYLEKYFWGEYFLPAHDNHIPVRQSDAFLGETVVNSALNTQVKC